MATAIKQSPLVYLSRRITPPRALFISFGGLIVLGALLLMTPPAAQGPNSIAPIDALFTAASAVCVTGLVVVDTGTAFSLFGQGVILTLIQLGGLGIMTLSVFFLRLAGWGSSLRTELAVRDSFSFLPHQDLGTLLKSVVVFSLVIELTGAVLFFPFLAVEYPLPRAAFLAVFHAISAFCNAGFALWPDSLTRYQSHMPVNMIVCGLIVCGGLGFIVLSELSDLIRCGKRLSLHSKTVLVTTAFLIVAGFLTFYLLESTNVLKDTPPHGQVAASLFQSITTRTAGFNTVEFAHLTNTTLLVTMFLMFVGGSPGSTAGGIKTVTLALLVAMAFSRYQGYSKVNLLKRSVSDEAVSRGVAIFLTAVGVVTVALALLLITETGHLDHAYTRDYFLRLLFETISAFATVGLSMGATAELTAAGKIIIILTMLLGRVGPLTVALAMLKRAEKKSYNYGEEEIIVG